MICTAISRYASCWWRTKLHFILTCKPTSHPALFQELELLAEVQGAHQTHVVRRWKKDHYEHWRYHWVEQVPIRAGEKALRVNWCEVTVVREDTGEQVYYNSWITSHQLGYEDKSATRKYVKVVCTDVSDLHRSPLDAL